MENISLKEYLEGQIRKLWFWAGVGVADAGIIVTANIWFGGSVYFAAAIAATILVSAIFNMRRARKLRSMMRDPMFYLLAARHDLDDR
jgi:hypothetical protein